MANLTHNCTIQCIVTATCIVQICHTSEFLRNDARLMPADETLKEHAKAIRTVKARQDIREHRMAWYKRKNEEDRERQVHLYR